MRWGRPPPPTRPGTNAGDEAAKEPVTTESGAIEEDAAVLFIGIPPAREEERTTDGTLPRIRLPLGEDGDALLAAATRAANDPGDAAADALPLDVAFTERREIRGVTSE